MFTPPPHTHTHSAPGPQDKLAAAEATAEGLGDQLHHLQRRHAATTTDLDATRAQLVNPRSPAPQRTHTRVLESDCSYITVMLT